MKKITHIGTVLVLALSFTTPLSALAACPAGCLTNLGNSASTQCVADQSSPVPRTDCGQFTTAPAAAPTTSGGGINLTVAQGYSAGIVNFINGILVPVRMAIAFIVFLWGVFKYFILGAADEKSRTDGRQFVLWGIIGFVVILTLWGLVNLVTQTLSLKTGGAGPTPPTI